ncbi:MAG: response regulator transcription factor [Luteibaculum sp.]
MDKILYLEDEPFLGQVVVDTLEENNYQVTWVKSGSKALEASEKQAYDIYLLDVMVPDIGGFAVGKEIRQNNPKVPIVFITAKSQSSDVVSGFDSGGTEYIKKPFSLEELLVRIDNQLRWGKLKQDKKSLINFGPFTVDIQRLRLLKNQKEIQKLTHREVEIFRLLGENLNGTVERKHLLREIWGDDSYYNSRNLDVYIKKLRDYLAGESKVEIITLKGLGYKLVG